MFLRPQHFQQHDLFVESLQVGYTQATRSFAWGLDRLAIDQDALQGFVFDVKALRAVFPDGTLVDVPGNARLPSLNVDPKAAPVGAALPVILGVRRLEERRPSTAVAGAAKGESRYLAVEDEALDVDAPREAQPIEKLEYDLQLFVGDEPTQGFEVLSIASLTFTGQAKRPLELTPGFAAPALLLSAAPALHDAARAVAERLATVLRRMDSDGVRSSDNLKALILYQALAGYLPVLKEVCVLGNVHPRDAYFELARLAGALFFHDRKGRSFDEIPAYDHREPGPVFEKLKSLIVEMSEPIFVRPYESFPLTRAGDRFSLPLPAEAKRPGTTLFLELNSGDSRPRIKMIMMTARISGPARLQHLTQFALPGIATEAQPGPPTVLPAAQHKGDYFRLKIDEGNEWVEHVVPADELCVFILSVPQDVKINLILVFPGA